MGKPQAHRFYDFGIFEPAAKPRNRVFLSLETSGHLKESRNSLEYFTNIIFVNLISSKTIFDKFGKDARRSLMEIRVTKKQSHGHEINIYQKPKMSN